MADIAADLITYLKTIAGVTNLVGTGTDARLYLHEAKQGVAMPYAVIDIFEGITYEHCGGISGMARNRVEVTCYDTTSAGAYALADAIRFAPLQQYAGLMDATTVNGVTSNGGYSRSKILEDGAKKFACARDYLITYQDRTS